MFDLGCSCGAVGEGLPRRYLARLSPHTRIGRVPISYPTTSTRRLMSPTADARTGRKAYADCRRDCRNTGINIQRGLRKVNTLSRHPWDDGKAFLKLANGPLAFFYSIKIAAFPNFMGPHLDFISQQFPNGRSCARRLYG